MASLLVDLVKRLEAEFGRRSPEADATRLRCPRWSMTPPYN